MFSIHHLSQRPAYFRSVRRWAWLLVLCTGLLTFFGSAHAQQASSNERWVSDSLNTYVRSGPTDGYRIVGTLTSGEKVELLGTQNDYSQVRGESGSVVWIPSTSASGSDWEAKAEPARPPG